jgi:hypothetical protein
VFGAVAATVALIAGTGAVVMSKSPATLNGLTADQVMQKMVDAAHQAGTAHVEVTGGQGGMSVNGYMDISTRGGTMSLSVTGASGKLQAVAIGDSLYINGSADLLGLMGLPDRIASHYSDQWVVVPTTDPDVRQMAEQLQTNVVVDDLLHLSGPLNRLAGTQGSKVGMTGSVPDNKYNEGSGAGDAATLEVSNTAPFVPLSMSYSDADNGSTVLTFSRWGEKVQLSPPPSPVPLPQGGSSSGSSPNQGQVT